MKKPENSAQGTNKLWQLIAVRHGEYYSSSAWPAPPSLELKGHLTQPGKDCMALLARKLRAVIPQGVKVRVLCATAIRAVESAEPIAQVFGTVAEEWGILRGVSEEEGMEMAREILHDAETGVLGGGNFDVIIVVTHGEAPKGIIRGISKAKFHTMPDLPRCRNGNGYMICLADGTVVKDLLAMT